MALRVDWSDEARADVRAFDRPTAMRIFDGVLRFVRTGRGDVQEIKGDAAGRYRLRVGDYRAFFTYVVGGVRIDRVKHRSEAYR